MFVVTTLQCMVWPAENVCPNCFVVVLDLQPRDGYRLSTSQYLFINVNTGSISRTSALCKDWKETISLSDNRYWSFRVDT